MISNLLCSVAEPLDFGAAPAPAPIKESTTILFRLFYSSNCVPTYHFTLFFNFFSSQIQILFLVSVVNEN